MKTFVLKHFGGKDLCSTEEEARAVLRKEVSGTNEFRIYCEFDGYYPYVCVFIRGESAHIWYDPSDISSGFQAYVEDNGLDPDGLTIFHFETPETEMEVYNECVIPKETAVETVLDFMRRDKWPASPEDFPACVEWDAL